VLQQTPALFRQVWDNSNLSSRERKRILGLIIQDVTLPKGANLVVCIRFKGGTTHALHVPPPRPFAQARTTLPETLALIDQLFNDGTEAEVAVRLNQLQRTTLEGLPFTPTHVSALRRAHHLKDRFTRLREAGWQTADEVAARFQVTRQTVWRWYHQGLTQGSRYNDRDWRLFLAPETRPFRFRRPRTNKPYSKRR
jgi:hypothetical protein